MTIKTGHANDKSVKDAVSTLSNQCDKNAKLVIYFSSSTYDGSELAEAMASAFPEAATMGCTSAGEIVSGEMLSNAVVAMSFDEDEIESAHVELIEDLKSGLNVGPTLDAFQEKLGKHPQDMVMSEYLGLIMIDGLSVAEERIMDKLGNTCDFTIIGGAAGDDLKFERTNVFANGRCVTDAAVLAIIKPKCHFEILKTQSFDVQDITLKATKVDEATRTVHEFNNMPAAQAYAEAVGCDVPKIADHFMSNTLGLMVGDEPYVRSPMKSDGSAITFYCNIKEGMELKLLKSADIVADTKRDIDALNEAGKPRAIINFHCILRTLELQQQNKCDAYGKIFSNVPTVGFSTYGEEYIGHINQTSTMVIFR